MRRRALLSGCAREPRTKHIAGNEGTAGTLYWDTFARAVHGKKRGLGYKVQWYAPQTTTAFEEQSAMLNQAIHSKVDGIVLAPAHQLVLAGGVRRAHEAGIPVVIVDAPIAVEPENYVASIACSDDAIGFLTAQELLRVLHGHGQVLVIGTSPTLEGFSLREQSLERALASGSPEVRVADIRYSLSHWARARQATLEALQSRPEIRAVVAFDEFSTHGALAAVESLPKARALTFVGLGADTENLAAIRAAIRAGWMDMTVLCDSRTVGELAVEALNRALDHKPVDKIVEERSRIAREIHDTLAQGFAGIGLQLQAATRELDRDRAAAHRHLAIAVRMVRASRAEAHRSLATIRTLHTNEALETMLARVLQPIASHAAVRFQSRTHGSFRHLSDETAGQVMRIAQEAVTNSVQHGSPTRIAVSLSQEAQDVVLEIDDDGVGFDVDHPHRVEAGHFGLAVMRERAGQIGAVLTIASGSQGTRVTLRVLSPAARRGWRIREHFYTITEALQSLAGKAPQKREAL